MKIDQYHRRAFDEKEICDILYLSPDINIDNFKLDNNKKYNAAVKLNFSDLNTIGQLPSISVSPKEWHVQNQKNWYMPNEYKELDIAKWVLDCCDNDTEIQRAGQELLEYAERNLLSMLCYIKYLVDTMHKNNIVWGVGRGSSVASFVLYKIGVHRINSLYYDLDFNEFMR